MTDADYLKESGESVAITGHFYNNGKKFLVDGDGKMYTAVAGRGFYEVVLQDPLKTYSSDAAEPTERSIVLT